MQTRSIRTLDLYCDDGEQAAAQLIGDACERSLDLIHDLWGLEAFWRQIDGIVPSDFGDVLAT